MGRRDDGRERRTAICKRVMEKSRRDQRDIRLGIKQGRKDGVAEI